MCSRGVSDGSHSSGILNPVCADLYKLTLFPVDSFMIQKKLMGWMDPATSESLSKVGLCGVFKIYP